MKTKDNLMVSNAIITIDTGSETSDCGFDFDESILTNYRFDVVKTITSTDILLAATKSIKEGK